MADGVSDSTAVFADILLLHWANEQAAVVAVVQEHMALARVDWMVVSKPLKLRLSSFFHGAGQCNVVLVFHKRAFGAFFNHRDGKRHCRIRMQ